MEKALPPREPELPVKKLRKLLNRRHRFALLLTALAALAAATVLLRKTGMFHGLLRALMLPNSWLSGTIIVKGFDFTSYHIQRDMAMIALISVTILITLQQLIHGLEKRKNAPPYGGGATEKRWM